MYTQPTEMEPVPVVPELSKIEILKRKHGRIFLIEVESDVEGKPYEFILKMPDRKIMGAVAKVAHSDPFNAAFIMVENCLLDGDKTLLEDVSIFSAVSEQFEKVAQSRKATLKNL